jgi:hypothetical protein
MEAAIVTAGLMGDDGDGGGGDGGGGDGDDKAAACAVIADIRRGFGLVEDDGAAIDVSCSLPLQALDNALKVERWTGLCCALLCYTVLCLPIAHHPPPTHTHPFLPTSNHPSTHPPTHR